ncbi:MAG TPA: hypothetical protein VM884_07985 [Flavisolibacter sp.]|nr:hypothetical protein [Flavisolibacter sp.]
MLLTASLFFTACNNNTSTTENGNDTGVKNTPPAAKSWTKEDELEFISGCVDKAKARFGEEKAYSYCKCILAQVEAKYEIDSTLVSRLSDTSEVATMAQNCE